MDEVFSIDILYADEDVPNELYELVSNGLCAQLKTRLDELDNVTEYLTALSWHGEEQLSLLMVASLHGHDDIVNLLLSHSTSREQVELEGKILLSDQTRMNSVTALYCALYRGHFDVARTLIDLGKADLKQKIDGSPDCSLLLHACELDRLDIVGFLIENGYADVNENKSSYTRRLSALMVAADRGYTFLVEYLIDRGADLKYCCRVIEDGSSWTPLMFAAARNHRDAFLLLHVAGAKGTDRDQSNNSVLALAMKYKSYSIISCLLEESFITPDDLERVACSSITRSLSIEQMKEKLQFLRLSIERRQSIGLLKVCLPPMSIYDYHEECQTVDELDSIVDNHDRIVIETLLIRERIPWPPEDTTMNKALEEYSTLLASREEFSKCLDVLIHLFHRDRKNGGNVGLHMFVWFFCQMLTNKRIIWVDRFVEVACFSCKPSDHKCDERDVNNALFMVIIATKVTRSI
jgi:ankyrin repeat protein